jgi:hypothetical protein
MIQRKQTLFLFASAFLGVALLFIPVGTVTTNKGVTDILLIPLNNPDLTSTTGHQAAITINFITLILSFVTVFLYSKRELQIKFCYVLMLLWLVLGLMCALCPFVVKTETVVAVIVGYWGPILSFLGIVCSVMAARFVKKDIELLKSADRIR